MIKPEFWEDSKIAKLSDKAKLLFIALWNFADDEGYLAYDNDWIRVKCFAYEKNIEIGSFMDEILSNELIVSQNGVIRIKNFLKHQKIKKPSPSTLKDKFENHSKQLQKEERFPQQFSTSGEEVGKEFSTGGEPVPSPYYKLKEVKGKEKKEKLKEEKGSMKGKETEPKGTENDKTDFNFGERQGTENDRNGKQPNGNGFPLRENQKANDKATGISTPLQATSPPLASAEIISDMSVNTFKARVEYAKSLGIEESVARRICNLAQSEKFPLCEMHYKGFVGKSGKEAEEAFNLLKFLAKRGKNPSGLKRINSG
jgi:hypothetical protein